MTRNLTISLVALILISITTMAQKPQTTGPQSKAEKMGYARTNKYWGPGTYYLYAPGKPINKMADNRLTAMRDLTGISDEDLYKELDKQGYVMLQPKENKKWFNESMKKDRKFYYSPDKSFILEPGLEDLYNSPAKPDGKYAYAAQSMIKYELFPKEDSLKVFETVWQFIRDLHEMKVMLGSVGSTFKKADPKAYPIQKVGTTGWTSFRAGTFVLRQVDGKVTGNWESAETIIRRTMGRPEFVLNVYGLETDFGYDISVKLTKAGYVVRTMVGARNIKNLNPHTNWKIEYPVAQKEYQLGVKGDKDAVETFKKAPIPPVLQDLEKMLRIKK